MVNTTCPSLPMRMKALGTNVEALSAASAMEGPILNPTSMPPPRQAPAVRNWRRVVMSAPLLVVAGTPRRVLDSVANPHISAAATDVPGHGGIDIAIGGVGLGGEQRRCGHDLAGLAVTALRHLQLDPCLLDLLAGGGRANGLDRGDALTGGRGDRRDARAHCLAIEVHRAGAAHRNSATELGAGEPDDVADRPKQRRVRIDVDFVFLAIHVERSHGISNCWK